MRNSKIDNISLGLMFSGAFFVRFFLISYQSYIENDGVSYVRMAKQWVEEGRFPEGIFPPLYPLLIGLAHKLFPNYELAGRMISALAGTLALVPVFLLCHRIYERRTAFYTLTLAIFYPALVENAVTVMTESVYLCLVMSALYATFMGFHSRRLTWFLLAGLLISGAYYTRPEGLLYLLVFLLFGLLLRYKRTLSWSSLKGLALLTAVTLTITVPYMAYIGGISKKEEMVVVYAQAVGKRDISRGIDEAVKEHYIQGKKVEASLFAELLNHPVQVVKRFAFNLFLFVKYVIPGLFPTLTLMTLAIGLLQIRLSFKEWDELFLLFSLSPTVALFFFFVTYHRFFIFGVPIGLMFCAKGLGVIQERLCKWSWRHSILRHIPLAVLVFSLLPYTFRPVYRPEPKPYREAGEWLKTHAKGPIRVLDIKPQVAFYAEAEYIYMPIGRYEEIMEYALKRGATHMVIDQGDVLEARPELSFLIYRSGNHPLLKRVAVFPYDGRRLVIWEIRNSLQNSG